jgi:hypothetical protein
MAKWMVTRRTDEYIETTNLDTGQIKQTRLATDAQWGYLEKLRKELTNREPLKHRPAMHIAKQQIDKLLEKKEKQERQQSLL